MAYNPSLYNPYGVPVPQQPVNGLVSIDSEDSWQMYPLPPNSVSQPLFLTNEDAFIIKRTDGAGVGTAKKYSYTEIPLGGEDSELYVTKEYFDEKLEKIMEAVNGERTVSEQPESEEQQ